MWYVLRCSSGLNWTSGSLPACSLPTCSLPSPFSPLLLDRSDRSTSGTSFSEGATNNWEERIEREDIKAVTDALSFLNGCVRIFVPCVTDFFAAREGRGLSWGGFSRLGHDGMLNLKTHLCCCCPFYSTSEPVLNLLTPFRVVMVWMEVHEWSPIAWISRQLPRMSKQRAVGRKWLHNLKNNVLLNSLNWTAKILLKISEKLDSKNCADNLNNLITLITKMEAENYPSVPVIPRWIRQLLSSVHIR